MTNEERLEKIEEKLEEISKLFNQNVINKAQKYDEIMSLLSDIHISAEISKQTNLDNGEDYLLVNYNIQPTKITCDDDLQIDCDKTFYSLNMLNLLGIEFVQRAQKEIEILKMSKK